MNNIDSLVSTIKAASGDNQNIVYISGNFNIIHPGHLRLINFAAECGDFLVAALNPDNSPGVLISEQDRYESLKAIKGIDFPFILPIPNHEFIELLKPQIVVKGGEFKLAFNKERDVLDKYGGKLLFSSGETFSSANLLKSDLNSSGYIDLNRATSFPIRHKFTSEKLESLVNKFKGLNVVVLGDLIVDEYVSCQALGMSREDATIVVSEVNSTKFIGGAGIVAAHAASLGAFTQLFGVIGDDDIGIWAKERLLEFDVAGELLVDSTRPTSHKKRYRSDGKTLLRVSNLRHHDISQELVQNFLPRIVLAINSADLVIFSDFSYGFLTEELVKSITSYCNTRGIPFAADSQTSSQIGDISQFKGAMLITPTEHEARIAIQDMDSGLPILAEKLRKNTNSTHILITMGADGLFIHSETQGEDQLVDDQLPAMNLTPKDVAGAGDCLLVASAMSIVAGGNIWESAYIGSIAAACQVGRVGNLPLSFDELTNGLRF